MNTKNLFATAVFVSADNNAEFAGQNTETLMSLDVWDAKLFPEAPDQKDHGKNYDFSDITQEDFKEEAKMFLISEFKKGVRMKTAQKTLLNIQRISAFMEIDQPYADSIMSLPEDFGSKINDGEHFFSANGYPVHRILLTYNAFRKFMERELNPVKDEMKQDRINLNNLGFEVTQNDAVRRDSLSLAPVKQDWLRSIMEKYIEYRLKCKSISTVVGDIRSAKLLSESLIISGSEITSLEDFSALDAMNLMSYVGSSGFEPRTYNGYINGVRNLLRDLYDNDLIDKDLSDRFSLFRPAKIVTKKPQTYSDREMDLIYQAIPKLPTQIQRVMAVLISTGWRISDILNIKFEDPVVEVDGQIFVQTVQQKTRRIVTLQCHDDVVPAVLKMAVEESRKDFGVCRYAFAKNRDLPVSYGQVRDKLIAVLNDMGALNDRGEPFRPKLHGFRRTKVTDLINVCGLPAEVAAWMVGQKDLRSITRYNNLSDKQFAEDMRPIHDNLDSMIRNRGYADRDGEEGTQVLFPLIDGACARPLEAGICEKIGHDCFLCSMFHAQKVFLPYYKRMLENYRKTYAYAAEAGMLLVEQKALDMVNALEKIVSEMEAFDA